MPKEPRVLHLDFAHKIADQKAREFKLGGNVISLFEGLPEGFDNASFGRYDDLAMMWLEENEPKLEEDPKHWVYQLRYFLDHTRLRTKIVGRFIIIKYLEHAIGILDSNSEDYKYFKEVHDELVKFKWQPKV